jgi:hypothetical protein
VSTEAAKTSAFTVADNVPATIVIATATLLPRCNIDDIISAVTMAQRKVDATNVAEAVINK